MSVVPTQQMSADSPAQARAPRIVVRRDLPGDRPTWTARAARIGGLLVALATAGAEGTELPPPVADGRALRAWGRTAGPVLLAAGEPRATVALDADDLAMIAAAGRVLAQVLRRDRDRLRGAGRAPMPLPTAPLVGILHTEARRHDLPAERLVAELGRAARLLTPHPSPDQGYTTVVVP